MQTIKEATTLIIKSLSPLIGENEARSFVWLLFDYLRGYSRIDLILKDNERLNEEEKNYLDKALLRLMGGEPIQYVLGQTEFMGLTFKVDKRVLIPRPETEELVEWVLSDIENHSLNILDIGTGSGCIPITLKKNISRARIEAWDISSDALNLAKVNALLNKVDVDFREVDVLSAEASTTFPFDIVVSNPPYVTIKEKSEMGVNVLDNEPHLALFVSDEEPLLFYNAIARLSKNILKPGGKLFFEINQAYGNDVVKMLEYEGFVETELRKDLSGRDRMIRAIWPGAL